MTMRKSFVMITGVIMMILGLTACGNGGGGLGAVATPTPIPQISPEQVLPIDSAMSAVGYDLVSDGGSETDGAKSVLYRSEPIGKHDVVRVTLYQFSDQVTKDDVSNKFYEVKDSRPSAEVIPSVGDDAFLAYPSVHVYKDGRYVQITAGSGADDSQHELLVSLAKTAAGNMELNASQPSQQQ